MVGASVAGYNIKKEVGEGGTSAVYLAEHPNHGTVALKVLREKLRQDTTAVTRFVREAKYGARVKHPNVVDTIEIGKLRMVYIFSRLSGPTARYSRDTPSKTRRSPSTKYQRSSHR